MKYPFPASSLDYRREASSDRISQRLSRARENKRAIVQRERQLMSEGPISVLWILQIRRQRLIRCLFKKPQVSIAAAAAIYVRDAHARTARTHESSSLSLPFLVFSSRLPVRDSPRFRFHFAFVSAKYQNTRHPVCL